MNLVNYIVFCWILLLTVEKCGKIYLKKFLLKNIITRLIWIKNYQYFLLRTINTPASK